MKLHPFLALVLGSVVLGLTAGMPVDKLLTTFDQASVTRCLRSAC